MVCCGSRALGRCGGCFSFWSNSRNKETFNGLLRPQRPQQSTRPIGSEIFPATPFDPPEAKAVPWQHAEAELQLAPAGDVHFMQDDAPHRSRRSDASQDPTEEEECSKHVQDCMHDATSQRIHDACLAHAVEALCHAQAAELEAQREAEAAARHLVKHVEHAAHDLEIDVLRHGLQDNLLETIRQERITAAKPSLDDTCEQQQELQLQELQQQEQQLDDEKGLHTPLSKSVLRVTHGGCQLELFTAKPKPVQRLQVRHRRTDQDAANHANDHIAAHLSLGNTTNWRGLPPTAEERGVKHNRTPKTAWAAAAAATAAAAAAAFLMAEAREAEWKQKQGSHEEDRQVAVPGAAEAGTGRGALKAWACNRSWKPSAELSLKAPLSSVPLLRFNYRRNRRRWMQQPLYAVPVHAQMDSLRSSTVATSQIRVNLRFDYI